MKWEEFSKNVPMILSNLISRDIDVHREKEMMGGNSEGALIYTIFALA